ncbi:MAG: hypothetical protein IJ870_00200 [Alphaproteobacteria bacterium]|nr:hypothetical protein [Alphaproteobacteria bacterium]
MKNIKTKRDKKLLKINEEFYDLIVDLKDEKFDLCACVVERAYQYYMLKIEKEYSGGNIN